MKRRPRPAGRASWAASVLLHAAIVLGVLALWLWARRPPEAQRLGVEAYVVMGEAAARVSAPALPELEPEPEPETGQEPPPEPETPPDVPDPAAEAEERRQADAVAEQRRLAQEREAAQREAEAAAARAKAEAEKAAREKAEKERAERERVARERAERERAERERVARESELSAQLEADARQAAARASGLAQQYMAQIRAKIEREWRRPPSATAGLNCEVRVTQVPGGVVTGVQVGRCNGDEAVRQSIEAAVIRASPLPEPPDPSLFDRNLVVTFRPEN